MSLSSAPAAAALRAILSALSLAAAVVVASAAEASPSRRTGYSPSAAFVVGGGGGRVSSSFRNSHRRSFSNYSPCSVVGAPPRPKTPPTDARSLLFAPCEPPARGGRRRRDDDAKVFLAARPASKSDDDEIEKEDDSAADDGVVPITLLSGFLGSGKTTALKNLLENAPDGVKIGVIVNDVAAVNIDSKLVRSVDPDASSSGGGVVQLQNGCACCSLADELMTSVGTILDRGGGGRTTDDGGEGGKLDAVVVELSGVADPVAVKSNWKAARRDAAAAAAESSSVASRADVTRVVTVVDACTFGTDWMTWDSAGHRRGWVDPFGGGGGAYRKVPELLAEQVEAADLILINKADLAGTEQVEVASAVARGLNERAELRSVEFGVVSPSVVLGEDDASSAVVDKLEQERSDHNHEHAHDHGGSLGDEDCAEAGHSHSHEHTAAAQACDDPDCTDSFHDHAHSHAHDGGEAEEACTDPDCTDPTHSHSHSHSHSSSSTDVGNLGISNFVFKASVPFHKDRLLDLLSAWPVPIKDVLDLGLLRDARNEEYEETVDGDDGVGGPAAAASAAESPFVGVLRSKGFCWFAPARWGEDDGDGDDRPTAEPADSWRHDTAMYWSHAGRHFGITSAGPWWGSLPRDEMREAFGRQDNSAEYDRILREDFVSDEFADRRQEIVFIGSADVMTEEGIRAALDGCLLTEDEMEEYRRGLKNYVQRTATNKVSDDTESRVTT